MRIVLDTNVLVSGLLSPRGSPAAVVDLVLTRDLCVLLDARILEEYAGVLLRPELRLVQARVDVVLEFLRHAAVHVDAEPLSLSVPDASDLPFLEVAVSGLADALVTGNLRHFPARFRHGVRVLGPTDFLRFWGEDPGRGIGAILES